MQYLKAAFFSNLEEPHLGSERVQSTVSPSNSFEGDGTKTSAVKKSKIFWRNLDFSSFVYHLVPRRKQLMNNKIVWRFITDTIPPEPTIAPTCNTLRLDLILARLW